MMQEFISVQVFAEKHNVSARTVRNWCAVGKIKGAFLVGKTWNIPKDAISPKQNNAKTPLLLQVLREQKELKIKGGIYHRTQIDLTYNSNHIEGSRLTHEQTRYIFETNTIGQAEGSVNVDDIIEAKNHFRCFDKILDCCQNKLTESFIKELHYELKIATLDAQKSWFKIGDYKLLPNEVGGMETCSPENVHSEMKQLLANYNAKKVKSLEDILDFHYQFEAIHPFQDGNGRVGRLLIFKECLANGIVPFIISDDLKMFYYRGLREWNSVKEYLVDTCLTAQDNYKLLLDYFIINY